MAADVPFHLKGMFYIDKTLNTYRNWCIELWSGSYIIWFMYPYGIYMSFVIATRFTVYPKIPFLNAPASYEISCGRIVEPWDDVRLRALSIGVGYGGSFMYIKYTLLYHNLHSIMQWILSILKLGLISLYEYFVVNKL